MKKSHKTPSAGLPKKLICDRVSMLIKNSGKFKIQLSEISIISKLDKRVISSIRGIQDPSTQNDDIPVTSHHSDFVYAGSTGDDGIEIYAVTLPSGSGAKNVSHQKFKESS